MTEIKFTEDDLLVLTENKAWKAYCHALANEMLDVEQKLFNPITPSDAIRVFQGTRLGLHFAMHQQIYVQASAVSFDALKEKLYAPQE